MNEFVYAIRSNSTMEFKRRYREECDVLLIDDVQFMAGKEQLQEEFFHTFNQLFSASKQIVITSDRPPKMIATLEDRLRSRFASGLTTDVQPPELETRLAILLKRVEDESLFVEHDVLELIATHVKDNIRELEGALTRVAAYGNLYGEKVTREMAERVLSDIIGSSKPTDHHGERDHGRDGRDIRDHRRGADRSESQTSPRRSTADMHVRGPRDAARHVVPGHRPRIRGQGPHHGHARRQEDQEASWTSGSLSTSRPQSSCGGYVPVSEPRPQANVAPRCEDRPPPAGETCGDRADNTMENSSRRWTSSNTVHSP